MPSSLQHRMADNWRVLLSIADDLGHGEAARATAVALCADRLDEDYGVMALRHIQGIFLVREIDRILSAELVNALTGIDDAPWHDWRGPKDDRSPRKLTQADLAWLLRPSVFARAPCAGDGALLAAIIDINSSGHGAPTAIRLTRQHNLTKSGTCAKTEPTQAFLGRSQ